MTAFAKGLSRRGYAPVLLAPYRKSGELISRWQQIEHREDTGEELAKTVGSSDRTQSPLERIVNLAVPMEPTITLSLLRLKRAFTQATNNRPVDLIFATANPLANVVGAALLKKAYHLPLVIEFRDPWTQNLSRNWPTRLHFAAENVLERWALRSADAVIMNTPTARENLLRKYAWLDPARVHVVSHGFDGDLPCNANRRTARTSQTDNRYLRIGYIGRFYTSWQSPPRRRFVRYAQNIFRRFQSAVAYSVCGNSTNRNTSSPDTILEAIRRFSAKRTNADPVITIDFIGGQPEQLSHRIERFGLEEQASVTPRVDPTSVRTLLGTYDLLYLTNPPITDSPFVGTKTFEYLAACRPVIAELPRSDQAELVERARAGWICPPGDSHAIATLFEKLLRNDRRLLGGFRPNRDFVNTFARRHQVNDLITVIEQATGRGPRQSVISRGYVTAHADRESLRA